jgi:MoxR-like ATPase
MNAPASPEGAGPAPVTPADVEAMAEARERKRIIGQDAVVELLLIALFARGHGLFVGVPGLAKTLLISTLAEALSLGSTASSSRPDLMPSDITGTDVLEEDHATGKRFFKFIEGPIFTNILLADEINRTPPKTQAALLQAMQEHRVTAGGTTYKLLAAVPGVRDAEPHRAGGHLPAARGAARPVHVLTRPSTRRSPSSRARPGRRRRR